MSERKAKQPDRLKRKLYPYPANRQWSDEISTDTVFPITALNPA